MGITRSYPFRLLCYRGQSRVSVSHGKCTRAVLWILWHNSQRLLPIHLGTFRPCHMAQNHVVVLRHQIFLVAQRYAHSLNPTKALMNFCALGKYLINDLRSCGNSSPSNAITCVCISVADSQTLAVLHPLLDNLTHSKTGQPQVHSHTLDQRLAASKASCHKSFRPL